MMMSFSIHPGLKIRAQNNHCSKLPVFQATLCISLNTALLSMSSRPNYLTAAWRTTGHVS